MVEPRAGSVIEPRLVYDGDAGLSAVVCSCGALMSGETGRAVDGVQRPHEWLWWRCSAGHITRAMPLPVQMARSV